MALLLCALVVTPASAGQVQLFEWPEALNLEEAAGFLRIEPQELEGLATRAELPARRIGTQWRFSRTALSAWLAGDWTVIAGTVPPARQYLSSGVDPEATPLAGAAPLTSLAMASVTGRGDRRPAEAEVAPGFCATLS
jgi:excisionase family DNA binding protein